MLSEMVLTSSTEVGPTEEVVLALLDYLVDPMLPLKANASGPPSIQQQKSVATQMHAAVLLYNYYHRTRHPELEFLDFESFCKLGIIFKPSLMAHMKFMHLSGRSDVDNLENQLSPTEKAIMDACTISRTLLDASPDVSSSVKEWPIIKVAILLIDSKKENCLLLFSSITNGVWSVIEKDLYSEDTPVGSKRKRINKRKPCLVGEQDSDDEAGFQQIAFSAVKETTGITRDGLKVLEGHVVYSLSREKTATRFYIVQCTQSINEDLQVPIKDAIDSLQGPVVKKSSRSWIVTPVVEYFHVLPYAGIVLDWFSREVLSNSLQDRVQEGTMAMDICQSSEKSFEKEMCESNKVFPKTLQNNLKVKLESKNIDSSRIERHYDNKVDEISDRSDNCTTLEPIGKVAEGVIIPEVTTNTCDKEVIETRNASVKEASFASSEILKQKGNDASAVARLSNPLSGPKDMNVDESLLACPQNENVNKCTHRVLKVYQHQKKRTPSTNGSEVKAGTAVLKTMPSMSECKDEKVDAERKSGIISHHEDGTQTGDRALTPFHHNSNYIEKLQFTMATKGSKLSQTALRVLIRKREKLSNQLRNLEDEVAVCERNIQAILNGAENDLDLGLQAIIDCCDDVCLQDEMQAQDGTNQHVGQGLPQYLRVMGLSEENLTMQTPCQELDAICCANNWTLPLYHVSPSHGGFVANVTVKGSDFERVGVSDMQPSPSEARDSAAVQMIAKVQSRASHIL